MTNQRKKSIVDRNNNKKVRYVTEEKQHSTLTINPILFELVEAKFGDAEDYIGKVAAAVRSALMNEAMELESKGQLYEREKNGELRQTDAAKWIRGKISYNVTNAIITLVADPELLEKI